MLAWCSFYPIKAESLDLRVEAFIRLPLALTPESLAGLRLHGSHLRIVMPVNHAYPLVRCPGSPESAYAGKETFLESTVASIKWVVTIVTSKSFFRFVDSRFLYTERCRAARNQLCVEPSGLTTAAYRISCAVRLLRLPIKSISLYFCATVSEGAADCCGKGCWHNNFGITQSCPVEWR